MPTRKLLKIPARHFNAKPQTVSEKQSLLCCWKKPAALVVASIVQQQPLPLPLQRPPRLPFSSADAADVNLGAEGDVNPDAAEGDVNPDTEMDAELGAEGDQGREERVKKKANLAL
jgi:hypothetical protein